MFTRLRVPQVPSTGNESTDAAIKAIIYHLRSLEGKGVLLISQAQIYVDQGLQFPATQVASTDANNLDDYKEGNVTFTDTSGAALALTTNAGKYTKVGRHVFVTGKITYPATASGLAAMIGGLPFTSAAGADCSGSLGTNGAAVAGVSLLLPANSSSFNPEPANGGGMTNAQLSGAVLWVGLHYIT